MKHIVNWSSDAWQGLAACVVLLCFSFSALIGVGEVHIAGGESHLLTYLLAAWEGGLEGAGRIIASGVVGWSIGQLIARAFEPIVGAWSRRAWSRYWTCRLQETSNLEAVLKEIQAWEGEVSEAGLPLLPPRT